jgi:hypothetical protein
MAKEWFGVDTNVAASGERGVVLRRERPADLFGEPCGDCRCQNSAGLQHPRKFCHCTFVIWDVLENFGADDAIEGVVGKWQSKCVAIQAGAKAFWVSFTGLSHCPKQS